MPEQRVTQQVTLTVSENTSGNARVTQLVPLTISENSAANARVTQMVVLTISGQPSEQGNSGDMFAPLAG